MAHDWSAAFPPAVHQAGYTFDDPFPDLAQVSATGLALAPGDTNRLFVLSKGGQVLVITNFAAPTWTVFLDLSGRTVTDSECGLLGLAFHPGWRTNREVFVFYSTSIQSAAGSGLHQRISRFLIDDANPNRALPDSEVPLISQYDRDPEHNGGALHFGPDGYLYASVGDEGASWDFYGNGQRIDGNFFSGILRLDVDRRPGNLEPNPHPAVNSGAYLVPADNPWVGATQFLLNPVDPSKVRTEFYAVGLRNPYRFAFDPATADLYVNDVGQSRREEINIVPKGGNCGWFFYEGSLPNPAKPAPDVPFVFPAYEYEHEAFKIAVVGGVMCRGVADPYLEGGYFFLDFGGSQGVLRRDASGVASVEWLPSDPIVSGMTDVTIHPQTGEILCTDYLWGAVWRFRSVDNGAPEPPGLLSATGLFSDVPGLRPASGLTPYDVNVSFWSDGASKRRWFGLPEGNTALGWKEAGSWDVPAGTVLVKHFDLDVAAAGGGGSVRRPIETRVLVRTTNGVYGASYRWNDSGTDASLVSLHGEDVNYPVAGGGVQTWHYPSRAECQSCHNAAAGYVLGLSTPQMNREVPVEGVLTNQIDWLASTGKLATPPSTPPAFLRRLAAADDPSASRNWKARSFLAANCSACHQPGGPTRATWDARPETPLSDAGIVQAPALVNLSDVWTEVPTFIADAGSPDTSALYRRVADSASYHMPPLATHVVNTNAALLLGDWISHDLTNRPPYAQWAAQWFPPGTPASQTLPTAVPGRDGFSNEAKWLLGETPVDGAGPWKLHVGVGNDGIHLRYLRRANLGFTLEYASAPSGPWKTLIAPGNEFAILPADQRVEVVAPVAWLARYYRVRLFEP